MLDHLAKLEICITLDLTCVAIAYCLDKDTL